MALQSVVVHQKLQLLEDYVRQLRRFRERTLEEVSADLGLAWAIEHGLQVSIQCVIDVCQYLVAQLALGVPNTSEEAVDLLRKAGVFPNEFAQTLVRMIRFRNILVHVYAKVDVEIVRNNLQNHLDDFVRFAEHVLHFLDSLA